MELGSISLELLTFIGVALLVAKELFQGFLNKTK